MASAVRVNAEARRSVTFDRGTEFSAWAMLHEGVGTDAWFRNPKAPWQKGTVENSNNRIRRWLPRTRDPLQLRDEDLAAVCAQLNGTPRKCLGWRTPAEVFRDEVLALPQEERSSER